MDIYTMPRQSGKTTRCVYWVAAHEHNVLIVATEHQKRLIMDKARHEGLPVNVDQVVTATDLSNPTRRRQVLNHTSHLAVDELDHVLAALFGRIPEFVTRTP